MTKKKVVRKTSPDAIDLAIMTALANYPPATMKEIAGIIQRSKPTVKQRMDWLMEHEYIRVAPNMTSSQPRSVICAEKGLQYLHDNI